MRLVKAENNGCVYASVAMLTNNHLNWAYDSLYTCGAKIGQKPFIGIYKDFEVVPDMAVICDVLWRKKRTGLVPFEFDPKCAPNANCPPISTWENPTKVFMQQLGYGPGLLEGKTKVCGHMCAWDGQVIYDPRGFIYSFNLAATMGFEPKRFWLKVSQK